MAAASLPSSASSPTAAERLTDSHGRVIHDLRVSITDRCNYKCVYCRTGEVGAQYPELGIAEYLRLIRVFVGLGITKVRLTGGEPLLRKGLLELVEELAGMRTLAGTRLDLALTTNGDLLDSLAEPLKRAGLDRVTVSMDAVEEATFERITRVKGSFTRVLGGIRAAKAAGLTPLMNMFTLGHDFMPPSIHAGGLRYHGMSPAVSHAYKLGLFEAVAYPRPRSSRLPCCLPGPRGWCPRRSRRMRFARWWMKPCGRARKDARRSFCST